MRPQSRARKASSVGGEWRHPSSSSVSACGRSSFARASSFAPGKLTSSSAPNTSAGRVNPARDAGVASGGGRKSSR